MTFKELLEICDERNEALRMGSDGELDLRVDVIAPYLHRLTEEEQQIMDMRLEQGLVWDAIAKKIYGARTTARNRYRRALMKLVYAINWDEAHGK